MCLTKVRRNAKLPKSLIGYRCAVKYPNGLYGPCHQREYMRFAVGGTYGYQFGDGFHVFTGYAGAKAYAERDSYTVLKVKCTDLMTIGEHDGYEAVTCGTMEVLGVITKKSEPAKKVVGYELAHLTSGEWVVWVDGGGKPTLNSKNLQSGYALTYWSYHKESGEKSCGIWCLVLTKSGEHLILPVSWLYTPKEDYVG